MGSVVFPTETANMSAMNLLCRDGAHKCYMHVSVCMLGSERANRSIQQLSSTLEQLGHDGEEVVELRGSDGGLCPVMSEEDKDAWSQKTQSEAGDSAVPYWTV